MSKAEHPIHPVSTAISTSRQQTTLRGYNQHARRPRPRTTCPPPLRGGEHDPPVMLSTIGTPVTAHRLASATTRSPDRLSRCRLRGPRFRRPRAPRQGHRSRRHCQ